MADRAYRTLVISELLLMTGRARDMAGIRDPRPVIVSHVTDKARHPRML
ncbi:MAG: hypothetical protein ABI539_07450 [Acidobacteriota bacterium]